MQSIKSKIEHFVHHLIPWCIFLLGGVIVAEVFFHNWASQNHFWVKAADYAVLSIFCIDLYFKFERRRSMKQFFRTSWLDILAVFPFFVLFRLFQQISALVSTGEIVQTTLHEVLESSKANKLVNVQKIGESSSEVARGASLIRREARLVTREAKILAKETSFATRYAHSLTKFPRFAKALEFFRHPSDHIKWRKSIEQAHVNKRVKKIKKAHSKKK